VSWGKLEAMVGVTIMRGTANAQTRGGSTWVVAKVTKHVVSSLIPYEQGGKDSRSGVFGYWL
jgi:hypothetical protein